MELADIRQTIDAIDDELVGLFVRRMEASAAVAEAKRETGKPVYDAVREQIVLDRVAAKAGSRFADETRRLYTAIMDISKDRQRRILG